MLLAIVALLGCGSGAPREPQHATDDVHFQDEQAANTPRASAEVRRAESLIAGGHVEDAERLLTQTLRAHPDDARAAFDLGLLQEVKPDPAAAEASYRSAIAHAPRFVEARTNLGALLRDAGRGEDAAVELRAALAIDPHAVAPRRTLALVLEDAGDLDGAAREYETLLVDAPDDALAHLNLGLLRLRANDAERAKAELRAALSNAQSDRALLVSIGSGLRRAGEAALAVDALERAIRADEAPPTAAILSELALAKLGTGDRAGAETTLHNAIRADARAADPHYLLGSLLAAREAYGDAIHEFEAYLALEPEGPHAAAAHERIAVCRRLVPHR